MTLWALHFSWTSKTICSVIAFDTVFKRFWINCRFITSWTLFLDKISCCINWIWFCHWLSTYCSNWAIMICCTIYECFGCWSCCTLVTTRTRCTIKWIMKITSVWISTCWAWFLIFLCTSSWTIISCFAMETFVIYHSFIRTIESWRTHIKSCLICNTWVWLIITSRWFWWRNCCFTAEMAWWTD